MIVIAGNPMPLKDFEAGFASNDIERKILTSLASSPYSHRYDSLNQLKFELRLRSQIVTASYELNKSGLKFEVFRKSKCNPVYWIRASDGGFSLRNNVRPSDAIYDIYRNGWKYATECATAMVIVYYKALLNVYSDKLFNKTFPRIELMNWHRLDRNLREVGNIRRRDIYLPGDRRYFANPDVSPLTPELQGENVIDLGNGLYYGHGMGITNANAIISELNDNRIPNATESAYLKDSAGLPDFKRLAAIYYSNN